MKDSEIGQKIKDFRLNELKMGLRKFAGFMGIRPSDLSNIERGTTNKCRYGCENGKILGVFPVWGEGIPKKDRKPYVIMDCPDCKPNLGKDFP